MGKLFLIETQSGKNRFTGSHIVYFRSAIGENVKLVHMRISTD